MLSKLIIYNIIAEIFFSEEFSKYYIDITKTSQWQPYIKQVKPKVHRATLTS